MILRGVFLRELINAEDRLAILQAMTTAKFDSARTPDPIKVIDLFAGAGGLSLGFRHQFGSDFNPVWANDFDAAAVETYRANFGGHCVHDDNLELLTDHNLIIPRADVVIGTEASYGN